MKRNIVDDVTVIIDTKEYDKCPEIIKYAEVVKCMDVFQNMGVVKESVSNLQPIEDRYKSVYRVSP